MIKSLLRYLLRDELNAIRLEALNDREVLINSIATSFAVNNRKLLDIETLALTTSDAVDRLERSTNDELDLLSGALDHLDDTVQGICEELNKDHDILGVLFDDVMSALDEHNDRLDELEA